METQIYKPYGMRHAAKHTQVKCPPGLTKQSCSDECDINKIVAKYQRTGIIAHRSKYEGEYMDIDSDTLHDSLNIVTKAETMFAELPSSMRNKFGNDPATFLDYVQDPKNNEELAKLGLVERLPELEAKPKTPSKTEQKSKETTQKEVEKSTDDS